MDSRTIQGAVNRGVINFVVAGELRSGTGFLAATLDSLPDVVCHANLLHSSDAVRRACHESYFGESTEPDRLPNWCVAGTNSPTNPFQYLNRRVFDNPLHEESAVGLRITYDAIKKHELYDLFKGRAEEGDFCVVHVVRNPVACFVSQKQAEGSNIWFRRPTDKPVEIMPPRLQIDPVELTQFVRDWVGTRGKVAKACTAKSTHMLVSYADLTYSFPRVIRDVLGFLERPEPLMPLPPKLVRLRNRTMRDRISSFSVLRLDLPTDVRAFVDAEDFF